jgi:hypothetical protein
LSAADAISRLNARALRRFGVLVQLDGVPVQGDYVAGQRARDVDGMPVSATDPMCTVSTSDVPAAPVGKLLVHPTEGTFKVMDLEADGFGLTVLKLQKGL